VADLHHEHRLRGYDTGQRAAAEAAVRYVGDQLRAPGAALDACASVPSAPRSDAGPASALIASCARRGWDADEHRGNSQPDFVYPDEMTDNDRQAVERDQTDESLRVERVRTDEHLTAGRKALGDEVTEARDKADDVLSTARDLEDQKRETAIPQAGIPVSVEHDRAREDSVLAAERSGEDRAQVARAREQLALASLLTSEREDTDAKLQLERVRADAVLSSRQDFMAMVSHDLRSLLGSIVLAADLVKQLAMANAPIADTVRYAETIRRGCGQMNRLVGDLVDVASIEAGKLAMEPETGDPGQLAHDAIEAFQPAAHARELELTCSLEPGIGSATFDVARILQVITNLVGNALKFTPKGGRVAVRVRAVGDQIEFAVHDTGEGVATEHVERVFDRFFQTLGNDRRGLGLGLFIAKTIVDAHGGRIWLDSTRGTGSTFFFTIPRVYAAG
jgi:signal transduction histidine kinase